MIYKRLSNAGMILKTANNLKFLYLEKVLKLHVWSLPTFTRQEMDLIQMMSTMMKKKTKNQHL
jgi:hypothetical protein